MYNLKKVRGKVVHKIIQEIVHNSIVSQKPIKLFKIYIWFLIYMQLLIHIRSLKARRVDS